MLKILLTTCTFVHCICLLRAQIESNDPPGHLKPLGSHMPPIEIEVRENVPDPVEFFHKYVKPGMPVVLKGAAKVFGNFKTWKDDNYLREKYGNWFVAVEVGKYEGSIFGKEIRIPFRKFIDYYKEKNIYLIQDIVPKNPMRDEISLLKSMTCGGYAELTDKVMLFYSSASTQSALHMDDVENMHCLLDGTKEWILFDRKIRDRIPRMANAGAYGAMDCRSVDMYKYPVIQELPWHHAYLEPGDCLFVPWGWPHHVKSYGNKRNMAFAVWFGPMNRHDKSDCPANLEDLPVSVLLGQRIVTKIHKFRNEMFAYLGSGSDQLSKDNFKQILMDRVKLNETEFTPNETEIDDKFDSLDLDKNGFISTLELHQIDENSPLLGNDEVGGVYSEILPDGTVTRDEL